MTTVVPLPAAERNRAIVTELYAGVNVGDVSVIGPHLADDVVLRRAESLPRGGVTTGRDAVLAVLQGAARFMGKDGLAVDAVLASETFAVGVVRVRAVPAPRGLGGEGWPACETFTFRDGLITEITAYLWDTAAYMVQAASS